ncbi:hypothetical protein D9615_004645 [Tricholomella constricta]|uniref:Alpha-galactosidase n=1 Tax=Tricholomella constricta TaxID=117010 RepID=A0A8H5M4H1_9AGAR|nr:hypothetical protein D9615_004645 [Tricholomella constricta]
MWRARMDRFDLLPIGLGMHLFESLLLSMSARDIYSFSVNIDTTSTILYVSGWCFSDRSTFHLDWETPSTGLELLERLPGGYATVNHINEAKILAAANQIVSLGLKDVGYEYVNIDDCWANKARDTNTKRMVPDPNKFPSGINGLATKIHALGLKIGIYSDAGTATCAGFPGSLGFESIDAATFNEWGIDYLKYGSMDSVYLATL